MAGEWLKFEANTPEKPEVFAMTVALGWDDPDLTVGKLLKVWRWFDQHTINGNAHTVTLPLLDRISGVSGFAQAMCDVGWLVRCEVGYCLPHFDRHNGKTAKDRALTAKRVANHKANDEGNAKGNADSVSSPLPREEKRREEKELKTLPGKPDATEVLDYLNLKTGKSYQPVKANIDLIAARLREGATVEQCKQVIDRKAAAWLTDDKMCDYLRPATLFNATKFAQYVGELAPKVAIVGGEAWRNDPRFKGAK